MRTTLITFVTIAVFALVIAGCKNSVDEHIQPNKRPTTELWLMPAPDSMIAAGTSKQLVHWHGDDPDGLVRGYLVAAGKLVNDVRHPVYGDGIVWRWTAAQESLIAFPLLTALDTFQVSARAVDNTFLISLPEQAVVRTASGTMYWDANDNGAFDSSDVWLNGIGNAIDPKGGILNFPTVNQPPTVEFFNPYDSTVALTQPETTFTAASFAWRAFDPDGNETVTRYEIALNDTNDASRILGVTGNVRLASLVVPRERSNGINTPGTEVDADVWSGTFAGNRRLIGTLGHLKLNAKNVFYIRARDIAGAASGFIRLPADSTQTWYVKNPKGKILIVNDYVASDKDTALAFYRNTLASLGYANPDVIDIGKGVTAAEKQNSKAGKLVPVLVDPAFSYMLHLYDMVVWYSDIFPSLTVAQYSLYQYVRDPTHHGKVIFSTMFQTASDPRGALVDFSPLDSIGSADLGNGRLLPTMGDTRLPSGTLVTPAAAGYPTLKFNSRVANHTVYMRPIYKRPDAAYIYSMPPDARVPLRYTSIANLNSLRAAAAVGNTVWACGDNGTILVSTDAGVTWSGQASPVTYNLRSIRMLSATKGWIVGDGGTILKTDDGGSNWSQLIGISLENLMSVSFVNTNLGFITGTNGLILRTTDAGSHWSVRPVGRGVTFRAAAFGSPTTGIAVGDSGIVLRTNDGGTTWSAVQRVTAKSLRTAVATSATHFILAGAAGTHLESTDAGATWSSGNQIAAVDINSIVFADSAATSGWACGANGTVAHTTNGGTTWSLQPTGIEETGGNAQVLGGIALPGNSGVVAVATGGVILQSANGGAQWATRPSFDLNVGVIDGIGQDGRRSFLFMGLPLHVLSGDGNNVGQLFHYVISSEFGL